MPRVPPPPGEERHLLLGELLLREKLITLEQLNEALALQAKWGSRLGDIILAQGWVRPIRFYQALARHYGLGFVNLLEEPVDEALIDLNQVRAYSGGLFVPWRRQGRLLWVATADPSAAALGKLIRDRPDVRLIGTSKFDVIWELQRVAERHLSHEAVRHLAEMDPKHSACVVITPTQKKFLLSLGALFAVLLAMFPIPVAIATIAVLNVYLFSTFVFRALLCWMSRSEAEGFSVSKDEIDALEDQDLPVYTILAPMFREPEVLPTLAAALKRMDYPRSKLDIKLVLEAGDTETIEAAKALALDATFEIIRVPPSLPRTKPKACNYALSFARGEYLTVYDADDKPEPDQLKKSVVAFWRLGDRTACVQSRLNFFNAEENWLTRMFALEYSLWFDMFLPALDRLRVPIPLGGTSNHFHVEKLRAVGCWDPYNVTGDADLGLRFAALGYRVGVVNSVTYEEAHTNTANWVRQRSRWHRGYLQTWLVNMRDPIGLIHRAGIRGFCSLQLFIGGAIFSALAYPFLMLPLLAWLFTRTPLVEALFPWPVLVVSLVNVIVGNCLLVCLSMLAAAKRHKFSLLPHALATPAYWFLLSVAAYKGLWQLIKRPSWREESNHGIGKLASPEVARSSS